MRNLYDVPSELIEKPIWLNYVIIQLRDTLWNVENGQISDGGG